MATSEWTPAKVKSFRSAYMNFRKYVTINSKEEGQILLGDKMYGSQRMFLDCVFDGLSRGIHDFKVLKSRQVGITTETRALSLFWLGMHAGLKGTLVFDDAPHLNEARNEFVTMMDNLPPHLDFPKKKRDGRDLMALSNDSTFTFLSAGIKKSRSKGNLGRSSGINFAHLSEVSSYENNEAIVSFKNSLSKDFINRLYIYESTPRGFNLWYNIWMEAKADDLRQATCFIGWWAKENQKIPRGTPLFERYGEDPPTEEEKEKIAQVYSLYGVKVDQEQLAWYRSIFNVRMGNEDGQEEDETSEDQELLRQEQSWTENDAFLISGSNFFKTERLTEIIKTTVSNKYQSYYFVPGSDFFECLGKNLGWLPSQRKRDEHLKVWEEPKPEAIYVVACDPAYGHDEANNYSAVQVLRCYADCLEQVAEYAYAGIETEPFAWVIASLAGWYKNSWLMVEINGPGDSVWTALKELKRLVTSGHLRGTAAEYGLTNIFANVRDYMYARVDSISPTSGTLMWKTDINKKIGLMERLRDYVSNGKLILHSMGVIEEMKVVVRNGDVIGAEQRNRDDRTFCLAMGIRAWTENVRRHMSAAGRTKEVELAKNRLTVKEQIIMFNKHKIDAFFNAKRVTRLQATARENRAKWRGR